MLLLDFYLIQNCLKSSMVRSLTIGVFAYNCLQISCLCFLYTLQVQVNDLTTFAKIDIDFYCQLLMN